MRLAIIFFLLTLSVQGLICQNKVAKGFVIDKYQKLIIEGASVNVADTDIVEHTNSEGSFNIEVPKRHRYLLISKEGFKTVKIPLTLGFQHRNIRVGLQLLTDSVSSTLSKKKSVTDSTFLTYKNAVTLAPLELIGGALAIRYERFLKPKHSLGVHSSIYLYGRNTATMGSEYDYYVTYQGFKLSPFYRFYPIRKKASSFFAEVKIPFGYIHFSELDYHYSSNTHPRVQLNYSFWTYGFGASVGMMFKLPKTKHGVINISVGYQYFPIDVPETIQYPLSDGTELNLPTDTYWWYWGGPGTSLDLKFTIGGIF